MRAAHGRRWWMVAALGVVATAGTVVPALAGGAGLGYHMVVVPDEVPPGGFFTVSNADGSECSPNAEVTGSVQGLPVSGWSTTADGDGEWSKELYIYPNIGYDVMGNPIPTPPGEYLVDASCDAPDSTDVDATAVVNYEPGVITVTATETPVEPTEPAAEVVELDPAFTG